MSSVLEALRRHPVLLYSPFLAALAAFALMPLNADYYGRFIYDDPQGDEQQFPMFYLNWVFQYTSGCLVGQWLSFVAGAALALKGARTRVAVALGIILAAVNFAVAVPLARAAIGRPP